MDRRPRFITAPWTYLALSCVLSVCVGDEVALVSPAKLQTVAERKPEDLFFEPTGTRHAVAQFRLQGEKIPGEKISPGVLESEPEVTEAQKYAIDQAHSACFAEDPFPSAKKCQTCHAEHYREWSASPHAYAQLSPIFNAMSNRLNTLTNGTLGDFCIRCHTPVGMALEEPIMMSNLDRHPAAREGVTCVSCHRMNQAWGKGSGRQALIAGGIDAPIYGPLGNKILAEVLASPEKYGVLKIDSKEEQRARPIHRESIPFFQISTSSFCGACHDVFAPNGFRLEDAFSEFKTSPAARIKGQSCQDCHMGIEPGVAAGYDCAPAARVGNAFTRPRKRTNHMMIGPDYSIVHPGIFPHNPKAIKETHPMAIADTQQGLATMEEWLLFDSLTTKRVGERHILSSNYPRTPNPSFLAPGRSKHDATEHGTF